MSVAAAASQNVWHVGQDPRVGDPLKRRFTYLTRMCTD
jgi:hypothetical protein